MEAEKMLVEPPQIELTRKEWRRMKNLSPMTIGIPFVMKDRIGSSNYIKDTADVERVEQYLREKHNEGMENVSFMHFMIAAYVRGVAQRPALNRFIMGQRIWTRKNVEVSLTIKKEMTLDSPDTVVKIVVPPNATMKDVYEQLNYQIENYRNNPGGGFDNITGFLSRTPRFVFRFAIGLLRLMDYYNIMPMAIHKVSPFHTSMFITSMGSLGIPPIYHHLYDFGTCPVFISFGAKKRAYEVGSSGEIKKRNLVDYTFVLDERICDGYYYASALKVLKGIFRNPWLLDTPAEVVPDVD